MTRMQDKSKSRGAGRSKARKTQSCEREPLCALNPADPDNQAERRWMARSESVTSEPRPAKAMKAAGE